MGLWAMTFDEWELPSLVHMTPTHHKTRLFYFKMLILKPRGDGRNGQGLVCLQQQLANPRLEMWLMEPSPRILSTQDLRFSFLLGHISYTINSKTPPPAKIISELMLNAKIVYP